MTFYRANFFAGPWPLWFGIIAFVIRTRALFRRRASGSFDDVDAAAAIQVVIIGCIAGLVLSNRAFPDLLRRIRGSCFAWLLLFYGLCAASAAWSSYPTYTLYRAAESIIQIAAVLLAVYLAGSFARAEKTLFIVAIVLISIEVFARVRGAGFSVSIEGLHSNVSGDAGLLLFAYCAGEMPGSQRARRHRLFWVATVGMSFVVLSTSVTVYVAFAMTVAALFALQPGTYSRIVAMGIALLVLLLALFPANELSDTLWQLVFGDRTFEQIRGMTGRVAMWQVYWREFLEYPVLGVGFATGTRISASYNTQAHNLVVSALLDTGLVGLSLFSLFCLSAGGALRRWVSDSRFGARGCLVMCAATLVLSTASPFLAVNWSLKTAIFCATLSLPLLHPRRRPTPHGFLRGGRWQ